MSRTPCRGIPIYCALRQVLSTCFSLFSSENAKLVQLWTEKLYYHHFNCVSLYISDYFQATLFELYLSVLSFIKYHISLNKRRDKSFVVYLKKYDLHIYRISGLHKQSSKREAQDKRLLLNTAKYFPEQRKTVAYGWTGKLKISLSRTLFSSFSLSCYDSK